MARIAFGSAIVVISLLFLGFLIFAASVTRKFERADVNADGVVALTGGTLRIRTAAQLLNNGRAKRLLISGANRITTRRDLRSLTGLPDKTFRCCVDVGYEALNTRGNADEARRWVIANGFSSLIVVTASYHMPRSLTEIGRKVPGVKLHAYPVVPKAMQSEFWWLSSSQIRILASEYAKFLASFAYASLEAAIPGLRKPLPARPDGNKLEPTDPTDRTGGLNLSSGQM